MINDQPVPGGIALQNRDGLHGISALLHSQPGSMCRLLGITGVRFSTLTRIKPGNHKTTFLQHLAQMPWMLTADKENAGAPGPEFFSQRHAAHDMAGADEQGCVNADGDVHGKSVLACRQALNISSAFSQSSRVSISSTRCLGRMIALE